MYLHGNGVEKSRSEAMSWIKQSIKELELDECYKLGMKFYTGAEVEKDYQISLIYIRKAAEEFSTKDTYEKAQAQLGLMYLRGDGIKKNHEKSMDLIEKSVEYMSRYHYYYKGMEFYRATELDKNYEISLLYLKEGAKKGDPHSQVQLAYMYSKGIGMGEDLEQARRWRNRIKYGYPKHDSISLAQIYHYDEGGIQDFSKALEYYQKKLYGLEEDRALRGIGLLYEYGDGVNQDYKKAMDYYKKTAITNDIGAYYRLALLYYYGRGVDQSYSDALSWFTKVAQSDPDIFNESYHVFIRDDSNDILNFVRYTGKKYSFQPKSIFLGAAHYYLDLMYRDGHGTAQNNDMAQAHFRKSLYHGIKRANNFILQ